MNDSMNLNAGLHSVSVVIRAYKRELYWDRLKPRYKRKETYDDRVVLTYDPIYEKRFIAKHLRLMYNETKYMIIVFEPGDLFGEMDGGLLPFCYWNKAWPEIIDNIEEATDAPGLFKRWHRLKRIELATDIYCPFEPYILANSLLKYPISKRYFGGHSAHVNQSVKYGTESRTTEFTGYDRREKSKGNPVFRFEFRLSKSALDRAFGLKGSDHVTPQILESKWDVDKVVFHLLDKYSMYEKTRIVPLFIAKQIVSDERLLRHLDGFDNWKKQKNYRYLVKRLREKEGIIVGSDLEQNVVSIPDLYEGIMSAYERSWEYE